MTFPIVRFSLLPHKAATGEQVQVGEAPWPVFAETLLQYDFRASKDGPLFSPAEYRGGRKAEHVQAIHFGVLDFDDVTPDDFTAALRKAEPFAAVSYTTWRQPEASAQGLFRARLVVAFSRPAQLAEWAALWPRLVAFFGANGTDEQCKDPCRNYYLPALPIGTEWARTVWRSPGAAPLDVDALLAMPAPELAAARQAAPFVAADPIPRELVARLGDKLSRRADPFAVRMGTLIKTGLDGLSMAQAGARDDTLWQIACTLGEHFTHGDPHELAGHFRLALNLMAQQAPDCPTLADFAEKISRAQKKIHEERAALDNARAGQRSRKISVAFQGRRSHPYTAEEIAQYAEDGPLDDRWLVQRGNNVYLLFAGSYVGPFLSKEAPIAAAQFLAPAVSAGVELFEADEKGNVKIKGLERLMLDYGRSVTSVEADLTATRAYLASDRHALIEAPCPLAPLEPAHDAEIAEWLALLGGDKVDALLDWIACVTDLQYPAPALYLKGEAGSGKTLLAFGLSRLWSRSKPTSLKSALSDFNSEIVTCPLVLADEKIPESWNGAPRTEELREIVTATEFELNRKYQAPITVRGALRIILAANNMKLISSREDFTPEDARALADRFLFVCPNPRARDWLAKRGGQAYTESFVRGDRIARHALWLREQARSGARPITRGGRLIVPGDADELMRMIQSGSGTPWAVLSWVWSFLHDQETHVRASAGRPFAALVRQGHVWIAPKFLLDAWDTYLRGEHPPTLERLTRALRGLLYPIAKYRYQPREARAAGARYQALDTQHLVAWCESQGEDANELPALLERETEAIGALQPPPGLGTKGAN